MSDLFSYQDDDGAKVTVDAATTGPGLVVDIDYVTVVYLPAREVRELRDRLSDWLREVGR